MNMYFRLLTILIQSLFRSKKQNVFDDCKTHFLVHLNDLDINFHMNNGRYLSVMDLGRTDLMLKAGLFWTLFSKGYYPVVVSEAIRFKKSIEPFQKYELITKIESWDDKDFFMTQKFMRKNQILAEGYIRGRFKKRGQKASVKTTELFHVAGLDASPPEQSNLAKSLIQLDSFLASNKNQKI